MTRKDKTPKQPRKQSAFEAKMAEALEKKVISKAKNAQDAEKKKEWFRNHVIITKA